MLSATSHQRVVANPPWLLTLAGSISLMGGFSLLIKLEETVKKLNLKFLHFKKLMSYKMSFPTIIESKFRYDTPEHPISALKKVVELK